MVVAGSPCLVAAQRARPPVADVDLAALLASASKYVAGFADRFSNMVGEETYSQNFVPGGSLLATPRNSAVPPTHRVLRSDLLLISTGGALGWTSYRDVFEVDGTPVRDRDERLTALFARPDANALAQAARIAQESARYNIGPTERTVNTPVLALLFLQASLQPHFRFALAPDAPEVSQLAIVTYEEVARPTIIRTVQDTDRPASGRFWIEVATGRILQSELILTGRGVTATFNTLFEPVAPRDIAVPVRLREEYQLPSGRLTGVATYKAFRKFTVSTRTDVDTERLAR